MLENWIDVKGYEGLYQVSNLGRVKSLPKIFRYKMSPERILKQSIQPGKEYLRVNLSKNGKAKVVKVHILVLIAFVSDRLDGMYGCHNDGNPQNNVSENLRWGTAVSNQKDRVIHGTSAIGEGNGRAILSKQDVLEIRNSPLSEKELSLKFGISQKYVFRVRSKKTWKHI